MAEVAVVVCSCLSSGELRKVAGYSLGLLDHELHLENPTYHSPYLTQRLWLTSERPMEKDLPWFILHVAEGCQENSPLVLWWEGGSERRHCWTQEVDRGPQVLQSTSKCL